MKIKQIEQISDTEANITWENGDVENFKDTDALTLLLMTDMKVGEEYQISLLLSPSDRSYFYARVYKITAEGVIFVNDNNEQILIEYKKIKSLKPIFVAKRLIENDLTQKQSTAKQRVEIELDELSLKCRKLEAFVISSKFTELGYTQQYLLENQLGAMLDYEKCLKARLDCWDK